MLEAACGSVPVRPAASNRQLSALTDVLHKLRVLTDQDMLLTVSQLSGRVVAAWRALRRDEAESLLARLRLPLEAGLAAPASSLLFSKEG
jgi:hypothetical protein